MAPVGALSIIANIVCKLYNDACSPYLPSIQGVKKLIIVIFVLLALILAVHEAGHALAFRKHGLAIKSAGIGIPWGPHLVINMKKLGFPLNLNMIPLAAYVELAEGESERLKDMPYQVQAECYGAGIIMNILFGLVLADVYCIARFVSGYN